VSGHREIGLHAHAAGSIRGDTQPLPSG
jgi:hypothetical protein